MKHSLFVIFLCCLQPIASFLVLVGNKEVAYPLAKRYSEFYNIPVISPYGYLRPNRFIMVANNTDELGFYNDQDITVIHMKDYPHPNKNPNYFLSWILQISI